MDNASLRALPAHVRRQFMRLAHGRPVSAPLDDGALFNACSLLGTERYYGLLDDLVACGAAASRQGAETALQGRAGCLAVYAVCSCHGIERLQDREGASGALSYHPADVRRHMRTAPHTTPRPVGLFRFPGFMSLRADYGARGVLALDARERLARLAYGVMSLAPDRAAFFTIQEDYARIEGIPARYGRPVALDVYRIIASGPYIEHVDLRADREAAAAMWARLDAEYTAAPWRYEPTSETGAHHG